MRKGFTILALFIITITLGIIEIINVNKLLNSMNNIFTDLNYQYEINQDNIVEFYDDVGDIKEVWERNENWLCFLFNNRDLSSITDSINRLQAYTKNNDYDNAICELALLKEYNTKNYHIMGFNIRNIL